MNRRLKFIDVDETGNISAKALEIGQELKITIDALIIIPFRQWQTCRTCIIKKYLPKIKIIEDSSCFLYGAPIKYKPGQLSFSMLPFDLQKDLVR